jgi:translation initiation factor RLI1
VYLIDEPSAYLDSEQRIVASKVIKRFVMHSKKSAFIVEHDFIMATYLADKVRGWLPCLFFCLAHIHTRSSTTMAMWV